MFTSEYFFFLSRFSFFFLKKKKIKVGGYILAVLKNMKEIVYEK